MRAPDFSVEVLEKEKRTKELEMTGRKWSRDPQRIGRMQMSI
jgi:hypothetical protein